MVLVLMIKIGNLRILIFFFKLRIKKKLNFCGFFFFEISSGYWKFFGIIMVENF